MIIPLNELSSAATSVRESPARHFFDPFILAPSKIFFTTRSILGPFFRAFITGATTSSTTSPTAVTTAAAESGPKKAKIAMQISKVTAPDNDSAVEFNTQGCKRIIKKDHPLKVFLY